MIGVNMRRHLLTIPTHKVCTEAIESYIKGLSSFDNSKNRKVVLVILDSSAPSSFEENHKILLKYRNNIEEVDFYHIKQEEFDCLVYNYLKKRVEKIPQRLLFGNEFSYGKMMNRLFMVSSILECDFLHRRDSDTYLQDYMGKIVDPLEIEFEFLGNTHYDGKIYMVGSSYIGDWGIDYSDVSDDFPLLKRLFRLSKKDYTEEELEKYILDKYINGSREFYAGKDELSFRKANYIDAGNYSIYEIFKYIPMNPSENTSGTDYIFHELLDLFKYSKMFHNRRVMHEYANDRYSLLSTDLYNEAKLYSRLVGVYNKVAINRIKDLEHPLTFESLNQHLIDSYLVSIDSDYVKQEIFRVIEEFELAYRQINDTKYNNFLDCIKRNHFDIAMKVEYKIKNHIQLLKLWEKIINSLRGNEKILKNFKI